VNLWPFLNTAVTQAREYTESKLEDFDALPHPEVLTPKKPITSPEFHSD